MGGHAGGRGLIPAHAGKTKMLRCSSASSAAHPRSRGENPSWQRTRSRSPGSSPLTRGKQPLAKTGAFDKGLIPAHAGKTPCNPGRPGGGRAHPRSRGENRHELLDAGFHLGSSPLTRGKHLQMELSAVGDGLIPAHAGKTASASPFAWTTWAHPRSRGENLHVQPTYKAR